MEESHERIRNALIAGCSEEQFAEMRCPKCGDALVFSVHPKGHKFFVRCQFDSTHFAMHGETHNPPAWWESAIGTGWC